MTDDNMARIGGAIDSAPQHDPLPPTPPAKAETKNDKKSITLLPADCPVKPLGRSGDMFYYLDPLNQLIELNGGKHQSRNVMSLFGNRIEYLYEHFRHLDKKGKQDGWRSGAISESLIHACTNKGIWDRNARVRGRGAWRGGDGELIIHCGDTIWETGRQSDLVGKWHQPGLIGYHVYPAHAPIPRPDERHAAGGEGECGEQLLEVLKTWEWKNESIDPRLLFGWIGCAMLGGALKWRPLAWITGGSGTGKSTLQELIKYLFGNGILATTDTTESGVTQTLKADTLPISIDEQEAEEDNRKINNIIKLARMAASGSIKMRGSANHQAVAFKVQSCFLFSSILIPPLTGQDRSRMAILDLNELPKDRKPPKLNEKVFNELGCQLQRRMVQAWPRWEKVWEVYRDVMQASGYSQRSTDQFATILAAADVMINDGVPHPDEARQWVQQLQISRAQDEAENEREETRCKTHMLSYIIDPFRGGSRFNVGYWVMVAAGRGGVDCPTKPEDAQRALQTYGLKIARGKLNDEEYLAVANQHVGLAQIFYNTHWAGRANTDGVWKQALRRLPGAMPAREPIYFGGHNSRATLVPLSSLLSAKDQNINDVEQVDVGAVNASA